LAAFLDAGVFFGAGLFFGAGVFLAAVVRDFLAAGFRVGVAEVLEIAAGLKARFGVVNDGGDIAPVVGPVKCILLSKIERRCSGVTPGLHIASMVPWELPTWLGATDCCLLEGETANDPVLLRGVV
jgi:hypothetical protein